MLAIPLMLTVAFAIISGIRFGKQSEPIAWMLVPMWLCYIAIAFCDANNIC